MAAEAVFKIKETEDKGKEIVKKANDQARQILADARKSSAEQKQALLDGALREKEAVIRTAVDKANQSCEAIASQGESDRQKLLAPDASRLESAIQLVMERIVSV